MTGSLRGYCLATATSLQFALRVVHTITRRMTGLQLFIELMENNSDVEILIGGIRIYCNVERENRNSG